VAQSRRVLDVVYEVPFLAHAPMEPINCVVDARADRCEIWAPHQDPDWARRAVAEALKLKPEQVQVHVTLLGGGFGRRFLPEDVVEAAHVSRAAGAPAKVVWTREDDLQHDWYRPASVHRLMGAVDQKGRATAWVHRIVAPSISEQRWPGSVTNGLDEAACEGATALPYAIPNLRVEYCLHQTPVPVSWWRSVYPSQNAFANECFLDELAHLAGQDPLAFRRTLLAKEPRYLAVLNLAAEQAGWGKAPPGHGLGLAIHKFWTDTIVAEVAEVSVEQGRVRVHRVTCAVDCGFAVNPDGVKAQIEGGLVYGLSAALHGAITIERGRVKQSNFHDYPVLRMNEMPEIAVHLVPSGDQPFGVGEPGTPPIAPAVANAVFAVSGKRVRELPIRL
jgi:isoquinoline 1-oxidoreductase beta subunit